MKSHKERARNRCDNVRLTLNGETKTLPEWAEILGLKPVTIHMRLRRGYSDEQALTTGRIPKKHAGSDNPNYRHGHAHDGELTTTYHSWASMLSRCTNEDDEAWPDYGGRGITVCDRWLDFRNFLADMGEKPKGYRWSIGRIENDGNYEPGNCRWEQDQQQARNRRSNRLLTMNGETHCVAEWAEILGLPKNTLHLRLAAGWSDIATLTTPHRGWGPGQPKS